MPYTYAHPHPALTTDIVLFRSQGLKVEVLLIQRGHPPFAGQWALPGGFVEQEEPLEAAARRELEEETAIDLGDSPLRQLAAFGDPGRDPRGWTVSIAFWSWLGEEVPSTQAGDDASDAAWWDLTALPALAFDHAKILQTALDRLHTTAGIALPEFVPGQIAFRGNQPA